MDNQLTLDELCNALGSHFRQLRLNTEMSLSVETVAQRANASVTAVRNLEAGRGTIKTMMSVLRALNREEWIDSLAPQVTINPLSMARGKPARQRARRKDKHG